MSPPNCDRCGNPLIGYDLTLELKYHHPRTLRICESCERAFTLWLGKHPLWYTPVAKMLTGIHTGRGYPTKEELIEHGRRS